MTATYFKSLKGLFMRAELIAGFNDAFCADGNKTLGSELPVEI